MLSSSGMISKHNRNLAAPQQLTVSCPAGAPFSGRSPRKSVGTLEIGKEVFEAGKDHKLSNLMISFYFKEVTAHSGCEFLHKSFREYLTAEGIVSVLKDYGRRAPADLPERKDYWRDFTPEDPRYWLTRKLGEIFCAQWLSHEIVSHIRELVRWEIARVHSRALNELLSRNAGLETEPMPKEQWERARDAFADLWDWWGEGVHLRIQPVQSNRDWSLKNSPFANELVKLAMRRANYNRPTPPNLPERQPSMRTLGTHSLN